MARGRKPSPNPLTFGRVFILSSFETAPGVKRILSPRGKAMYYAEISADRVALEGIRRDRAVPGERVVAFNLRRAAKGAPESSPDVPAAEPSEPSNEALELQA